PRQVEPTPGASVWGQGERYGELIRGPRGKSDAHAKLDDCAAGWPDGRSQGERAQAEPPPDGDQATRWYRWWSPPTCGMVVVLPGEGACTARGCGLLFASA